MNEEEREAQWRRDNFYEATIIATSVCRPYSFVILLILFYWFIVNVQKRNTAFIQQGNTTKHCQC